MIWGTQSPTLIAATEFHQRCEQICGILVVTQIPHALKQKCREFGVETVKVCSSRYRLSSACRLGAPRVQVRSVLRESVRTLRSQVL